MSFDCRLLPDTDERAFVSNLEQLVNDPGVTFEVTWPEVKAAIMDWGNPLFIALEAACRQYAPKALVTPSICVGGTDARYFRDVGVPSFGLVPGLFNEDDMKGYHGLNERLSIKNLELGTKIIYETTLRAAAR
jgi:acetylornithine deacetylase/succinyl-diaminopimelate desuccinylase-like protein